MNILPDLQSHASREKPDWDYVVPEMRNGWQRMAARTNGVITPGNVLTIAGAGTDVVANYAFLSGKYRLGALCLVTEGVLDLLDGHAAAATGTRSPLGRALDAGSDAARILLTASVMTHTGILPKPAAGILATEKCLTALPGAIAKLRNINMTPSSEGKLTAFFQRSALVGFVLAAIVRETNQDALPEHNHFYRKLEAGLTASAWSLTAGSAVSFMPAVATYTRAALQIK